MDKEELLKERADCTHDIGAIELTSRYFKVGTQELKTSNYLNDIIIKALENRVAEIDKILGI